jgi:hypothetical protein
MTNNVSLLYCISAGAFGAKCRTMSLADLLGQFYTKSLILPSSFYIMSSTLKKAKQCIPAEIRMISGCRDAQISTPSGFKNNL